ncbi:MAG: hypothetical protein MR970_08260 [Spirochaetia bacterium]|nr:hypothetical protein [Spirochaetia bacterium]
MTFRTSSVLNIHRQYMPGNKGKSVPTIDNLLILATIFNVAVEEIIITHIVEIELASSVQISACKNCKKSKQQKAAFVKIA